ncbi:GntR family transcriptional regulator [Ilumatobacter sp.]|uniref:GntR family transcriptional regulator n=1 Tax=Ilumatobacter sp. TaxID=1967498 RepID=UPI003AF6AC9C
MTSRDLPTGSVTDELRRDILDGRFEPGDRLLEVPLSQHYACGRAAVRSALVELTTEGLVEREANRGATVRRISITEAIQITEARAALEGVIAAHAARNATDDERTELHEIIDDMRVAVGDDRAHDYSGLNARFHRRLREMSGHTVAAQLVANLRNRASHHQYRLALMPGRPNESLEQHAAIADAVSAGDESAAAAAMDAHLRSVIDVLSRWGDVATMP